MSETAAENIVPTDPDSAMIEKHEGEGRIVACALIQNENKTEALKVRNDQTIIIQHTKKGKIIHESTEAFCESIIIATDKVKNAPDNKNIPNVSVILSQSDSAVVQKNQVETCTESGVSKMKRQFESSSRVTSPVLGTDRIRWSSNNVSVSLAKLKNLEGMNEDGKKTNNVEDKIKKFNQASNLQNTQTLVRSKRNNTVRVAEHPANVATKETVSSPLPYSENICPPEIVIDTKVLTENKTPLHVPNMKQSVTDAAQNPEMYLFHQKSQKKTLDKAKSVDETAVKHFQNKSVGPHVSLSSFKSSHSTTEILHREQTREVKKLQTQFDSVACPSVVESKLSDEIINSDDSLNVRPKSSMRQPIKTSSPNVSQMDKNFSQETPNEAENKTESVLVECNSSDVKLLLRTCTKKSRDSIPTVPGSSYFTRGSEEIWLVKKKDIEAMEDKVIQSLFKGDPMPATAAPVKEQEKIDFLNRPVSTCKSFRRSPVPSNSKETKQQKESHSNTKEANVLAPSCTKVTLTDQAKFSHNTETRRSKRFFQFRSESVDPQVQADFSKSQTLKRQTSVSCTCSHDKKLRSKSQSEPVPSPRTLYIPEETEESQKQKTRSRSQGATDVFHNRTSNLCAQKSVYGIQQKSNLLYREVHSSHGTQSDEDLYEKYETLV